jgi:CYTH domain-containing protein
MANDRWRKLLTAPLDREDIYRDMARVNLDSRGRGVKEGRVYRVRVKGGRSTLLTIRGSDAPGEMHVDNIVRRKLDLEKHRHYFFASEPVSPFHVLNLAHCPSRPI